MSNLPNDCSWLKMINLPGVVEMDGYLRKTPFSFDG